MPDYVCSECGKAAYHDGRNGDGAILVCGCDTKGEPVEDSRMGSTDTYYPDSRAKPIRVKSKN